MVFCIPVVVELSIRPARVSREVGNKQSCDEPEEEAKKHNLRYSAPVGTWVGALHIWEGPLEAT